MSGDDRLADGVKAGWRGVEDHLDDRQRELCRFADKLTRTPADMQPADLEALREVGLEDEAIVDVVHVVGWFNHINRVADALGVDPQDFMQRAEHARGD